MTVHVFDQCKPLKKVILGSFFKPEYFDSIADTGIRENLKQILTEVHEDLDNFERVLKDHGVEVLRPVIEDAVFDPANPIRPPITPRDNFRVIGNQFVILRNGSSNSYITALVSPEYTVDLSADIVNHASIALKNNLYYKDDRLVSKHQYNALAGGDWPLFDDFLADNYDHQSDIGIEIDEFSNDMFYHDKFRGIDGPTILVFDKQILIDQNEYCNFENLLQQRLDIDAAYGSFNLRSGHTDGIVMVLNHDTILSVPEQTRLIPKHFKNKIIIPDENYHSQLREFVSLKPISGGKWWVPGRENDQKLSNFIESYLSHWVGYVEETVFDINCLVLNETTVFTTSQNEKFIKMLSDHGITAIHVPWRHRFFIDSGLHCITLDLWRE